MATYTPLYLNWITNKDLRYSLGERAVWRKKGYMYMFG